MCDKMEAVFAVHDLVASPTARSLYVTVLKHADIEVACLHGSSGLRLDVDTETLERWAGIGRKAHDTARVALATEGLAIDTRLPGLDKPDGITVLLQRCDACAREEQQLAADRERRREARRAERERQRLEKEAAQAADTTQPQLHKYARANAYASIPIGDMYASGNAYASPAQAFDRDRLMQPATEVLDRSELEEAKTELKQAGVHRLDKILKRASAYRVQLARFWLRAAEDAEIPVGPGILVKLMEGQANLWGDVELLFSWLAPPGAPAAEARRIATSQSSSSPSFEPSEDTQPAGRSRRRFLG